MSLRIDHGDQLPRTHHLPAPNARRHRLEAAAQADVRMIEGEHAPVDDGAGEGHDPVPRGPDLLPDVGGQIDATMSGGPSLRRPLERALYRRRRHRPRPAGSRCAGRWFGSGRQRPGRQHDQQ